MQKARYHGDERGDDPTLTPPRKGGGKVVAGQASDENFIDQGGDQDFEAVLPHGDFYGCSSDERRKARGR